MGQAPASGRNSLRTVPRNFPGRSGTREDSVYLCSPETAAASALSGCITDPRDIDAQFDEIAPPLSPTRSIEAFQAPLPPQEAGKVKLVKGPNIRSLPALEPLPNDFQAPILLVAGDDVSTDEILPAGAEVLPYRSNVQRIADFTFRDLDPDYAARAEATRDGGGHVIVGGRNYGQGSSREHAALAPRYLGLLAVVAQSYARIYRRNLINYGVLPLILPSDVDRNALRRDAILRMNGVLDTVADPDADRIPAVVGPKGRCVELRLDLTAEERAIVAAGGLINAMRARSAPAAAGQ
jgi:aconitate hydratase